MTKSAAKPEPELFEQSPKSKPGDGVRAKQAASPKRPPVAGSAVQPAPAKKQDLVVHQAQPKSLLQVIAEAASDPAVDVQKMKELLAIQKDMEAREAERIFNDALVAAKAEMPLAIGKDRANEHTKSRYVTLEKVSRSIDKIIAKHGFFLSYGMAESSLEGHYRITAKLSKGGHSRDYFIDLPSDTVGSQGKANKTPVQGIGSTISYGKRYLKIMAFDINVANEDDDGQGGAGADKITEEQADELLRMCAEKNIGADLFSKAFGVSSFADLPARRFEEAKSRLALAPAQQPKQKQQEQHHDAG